MKNTQNPAERHASYDWTDVDWHSTDSQIARIVGCSQEAVRQQREKRRIPQSPLKHMHMITQARLGYILSNPPKTAKELSVELDWQQSQVYILRKRFGLEVKKGHFSLPYERMDWRLGNRDLARVWQSSEAGIANARCKLKKGRAEFDMRINFHDADIRKQLADQEEQKAREYLQANPRSR